ncbi:hypothetical protein CW749_03125 [Vibrio sp. vnigr-6D03]|uniref:hypothetical protein n=1 Tax=Vibrio sp. vnigr-6D03 TaxID=2058088 RepID=UPI000C33F52A|nr:hypothetical protein [Vibrio sp. vnigr-6D03]PKF81643.1 hypothetical protein CW749_03125 [Vibrio sp. vnigr-6D03]
MNKAKLFRFLVVIFLLIPFHTSAGGWSGSPLGISQFLVEADNRAYVVFSSIPFPNECSSPSDKYHRIDPSTPKGKTMISMILAFKVSGKSVTALVGGCDDWNRPILKGLSVN